MKRLPTNFDPETIYRVKGSLLSDLCRGVNRSYVRVGPGLKAEVTDRGTLVALSEIVKPGSTLMVATVTAAGASDGLYQWTEKLGDADGDDPWGDHPNARTHETDGEALELNGVTDVALEHEYLLLLTFDDTGARRWVFDSGLGTHASPATVGATNETETAATDTWDRSSQGANDGVTVTMLTRMAYNHSGDEVLYAYYRDFTYDSRGNLASVSAETRVSIDTPEDC